MFTDLTNNGGIFANKEVLRPMYIPEQLPHRTEQIKGLAAVLATAFQGKTPANLLIYGKTGTGKTATVKYVCTEFEKRAQQTGSNCSLIYVNGDVFDTPYRVFAYLARVFNRRVPMIGWPADLIYAALKEGVDAKERLVIVTLDGIDKLASTGNEALSNISRISGELDHAGISVIGITNDHDFSELLDPRVKASLSAEEMTFPPYTVDQLADILYERAEKAFKDASLDDAVIPLCATLAASEPGNAKHALDLLRVAGEIAERSGAQTVCEEHVRLAHETLEMNEVSELIKTLPRQAKIVLSSVLLLSSERNKRRFTSGEVYTRYQDLCAQLGMDALTSRRVTDFVSELDVLGLVKAVNVSKGRYGRTKQIVLNVPEASVQEALLGDTKLRALYSTISERTSISV